MTDFAQLFDALSRYAESNGIRVETRELPPDVPAEFDGLSITINERHDVEARCYYLVHSIGSIVGWAVDFDGTREMFHELRDAKADKDADPDRLERALKRFLEFEARSSEYAVWILQTLGHPEVIHRYTEFFRADAAAMEMFHRSGKAPEWPPFIAEWRRRVDRGEQDLVPYLPRKVPAFRPRKIEHQEVVQEKDD